MGPGRAVGLSQASRSVTGASDRTRSALVVLAVAASMAVGFLAQEADLALSVLLPFVVLVPSWLLGDAASRARPLDDSAGRKATGTRGPRA